MKYKEIAKLVENNKTYEQSFECIWSQDEDANCSLPITCGVTLNFLFPVCAKHLQIFKENNPKDKLLNEKDFFLVKLLTQ